MVAISFTGRGNRNTRRKALLENTIASTNVDQLFQHLSKTKIEVFLEKVVF
jgi:hypothetical protein